MINFSVLISTTKINGPGGLFDINATLPLIISQFLILMVILNIILYNPLLKIIEKRRNYILTNLNKASKTLIEATKFFEQYDQNLLHNRKLAQLEIEYSKTIYRRILEFELNISQKDIETLLNNIETDFFFKKGMSLINLNEIVQSLYLDIKNQLEI